MHSSRAWARVRLVAFCLLHGVLWGGLWFAIIRSLVE
jgi:hypothetical protein